MVILTKERQQESVEWLRKSKKLKVLIIRSWYGGLTSVLSYGQNDIRHKGRYNTNLRAFVPEGRRGPRLFG